MGHSVISFSLRRMVRDLAELTLPAACEACAQASGQRRWICSACDEALARIERAPACERCAYPLALWGDPCPRCLGRGRRPFNSILRLGRYESPLRELIHAMKYRGHWGLASDLADRLLQRPHVREVLSEADAIVPVPLHRWRAWRRGFNQSELLCRRLGQVAEKPVLQVLRRDRNTPSQTALHSVIARRRNMRNAFSLLNRDIRGMRLLLVDDVTTTGATLRSAGRVLRAAGAGGLDALVLAVADPRHRDFEAA